jgi:hypothetical protein
MKEPEKNLESFLSQFRRKPAPPELKERILRQAEEKKRLEHVITPFMWKLAAVSLTLIVLSLGAELIISPSGPLSSSAVLSSKPGEEIEKSQEEITLYGQEILGLSKAQESLLLSSGLNKQKMTVRTWNIKDYLKLRNTEEEFNGS